MPKPIVVDAHEDIAWNKFALGRDFRESVAEKRHREGPLPVHGEGSATTALADLVAGNVRVVFSTLYVAPALPDRTGWGKTYQNPEEAHAQAMEQLEYYRELAREGQVTLVRTRADLDGVLNAQEPRVGFVVLMEGADPIIAPAQTGEWYDAGVRIVGPAWSQTRYSGGTRAPGGLTALGRELMLEMERVGMILDTSHMAEESFFQALDLFHGTVIASHANARAFVDTDRQLSDEMIKALVSREGVIGAVFYNHFIQEGWDKGARKDAVTLADVVRHMQRICDIAGDAKHVAIGTDFDGGFGMESTPREIDTVADLQKLADVLAPQFDDEDIANILGGNWIRVLQRSLP